MSDQRVERAKVPIVLASASPRREQILRHAGIPFLVVPAGLEEEAPQGEPEAYVVRQALAKTRHVASRLRRGLVLGADTLVVDGDALLGKPRDAAQARRMLEQLRGRRHRVVTGVAVVRAPAGKGFGGAAESLVTMRAYEDAEIEAYIASGESLDKAGAYAIQNPVFRPVVHVEGCWLNVVGLPLCLAVDFLQRAGAILWEVAPPDECLHCPLWHSRSHQESPPPRIGRA
ncbi:MAG: septum formation protein Maf [Chloroflexi bacterium]|nr:septum formation protein Maf [Chloroflexota bacterium]